METGMVLEDIKKHDKRAVKEHAGSVETSTTIIKQENGENT